MQILSGTPWWGEEGVQTLESQVVKGHLTEGQEARGCEHWGTPGRKQESTDVGRGQEQGGAGIRGAGGKEVPGTGQGARV